MKNRLVFSFVLLALLSVAAVAQGRGMRSPEERAKQLKEQLTLTDDQTVKVLKIFEEGQKKMQEMMSNNTGDRDAMRKSFMETAAKQDSLIEKLLTKEQLTKYEALKKERRQRMQQNQRGQ
ncbi:MAG: hypothetical protein MN733_14330 [Nitrososphaera sp.]|nr:hypothetical protein [Nitrososphaera sp.]